ncbi:MAG: hypothetical protein FJZ96_10930 [Chloroflexi bacterium]|nr:hypothetical protein [Chloroflexota bacterium]
MKKLSIVLVSLTLLLSACLPTLGGGEVPQVDRDATSVALTIEAGQQVVPPVQQNPPQQPTQTPEPDVMATANVNANCRSGPGGNFDFLGSLKQGESVPVIGQNTVFEPWWQLELSDGTQCWVTGESLTVNGNTDNIPHVASPATPTPKVLTWAGTWDIWVRSGISGYTNAEGTMTCTQTGTTVNCGPFLLYNLSWTIYGTSGADNMTFLGTLRRGDGAQFNMRWYRNESNLDQFGGAWWMGSDMSTDGDWCGSINDAPKPDPCKR